MTMTTLNPQATSVEPVTALKSTTVLEELSAMNLASPTSVANGTSSPNVSDGSGEVFQESSGADDKGKGWRSAAFDRLKKIIVDAKGAASEQVVNFVMRNLRGTKLILVVGQSGTGKTTMLHEMTRLDLKIGGSFKSGTLQYQVCPAIINQEQYLFVDTAGFGAADMDDDGNYKNIISCLTTLGPFVTIVGVLFVYGPPGTRILESDLKTIQWVQCFCGPEFYQNIVVVTSMWDSYNDDSFEEAWCRMLDITSNSNIVQVLDPPDRYYGGCLYHHGLPGGEGTAQSYPSVLRKKTKSSERGEELRKMIQRRYADFKPVKLQVIRELESGTPQDETEAAKVLRVKPVESKIIIMNGKATVSTTSPTLRSPESQAPRPLQSSTAKAQADKGRGTAKQENSKTQSPPKVAPPTWIERIFMWFEIGKQAANYYHQARQGGPTRGKMPAWGIWDTLKNWWSGAPPEM